MITFGLTGSLLGLSAGFSPGPLTALVVSESIRHSSRAGMKAGLAPLICDAPIILLTLFLISRLSHTNLLLAVISFIGALYIGWLGIKNIRTKSVDFSAGDEKEKSLQKGIIVNFLNPHPYIFWLTVGAPIVVRAASVGWIPPAAFLLGFYAMLVGAKLLMAFLAGSSKKFFAGKAFILINRLMGLLLIIFAIILAGDGVELLSK